MKRASVLATAASLAAMFGMAVTGMAQPVGPVIVDISDVAGSVASNLQVEASKVPLTIQLPVEVASDVCGVAQDVLNRQTSDKGMTCKAKTTSSALEQHVRRQVTGNEKNTGNGQK